MSASAAESARARVLVIEDEAEIRELLLYNLNAGGYEARGAESGTKGLEEAQAFQPDVVLLDLMLPDLSGNEVCRRLRADPSRPPPAIIMLTARSEELDRVVGFELGASDYVVKPFSMRELLLRVRACLRKGTAEVPVVQPAGAPAPPTPPPPRQLELHGIRVDLDRHKVYVGDAQVYLTALEIRLLVDLMRAQGKVRTREQLLRDVWGYAPNVSTRTVDTHIKRLRDGLGSSGDAIETVRGVGYRFADVTSS